MYFTIINSIQNLQLSDITLITTLISIKFVLMAIP